MTARLVLREDDVNSTVTTNTQLNPLSYGYCYLHGAYFGQCPGCAQSSAGWGQWVAPTYVYQTTPERTFEVRRKDGSKISIDFPDDMTEDEWSMIDEFVRKWVSRERHG